MNIREAIDTYIPDKAAFYEYLLRQRYHLPSESSSIISVKFMDGVLK